jgi:hypothetical protein
VTGVKGDAGMEKDKLIAQLRSDLLMEQNKTAAA